MYLQRAEQKMQVGDTEENLLLEERKNNECHTTSEHPAVFLLLNTQEKLPYSWREKAASCWIPFAAADFYMHRLRQRRFVQVDFRIKTGTDCELKM